MPIYEYNCLKCGYKYDELTRSFVAESPEAICGLCGGRSVRIMSIFAYHRSDGDRLSALDTRNPYSRDYLHDDRNIGGLAKKRLIQNGVLNAAQRIDRIVSGAKESVKEAFK